MHTNRQTNKNQSLGVAQADYQAAKAANNTKRNYFFTAPCCCLLLTSLNIHSEAPLTGIERQSQSAEARAKLKFMPLH